MTLLSNTKKTDPSLQRLADVIGHRFTNDDLLKVALTHTSAAQDVSRAEQNDVAHNERLEFLGDAVLGLVVATELMHRPQSFAEGEMSRLRAGVVQESVLAEVARSIDLGSYLTLGRGERVNKGADKASVLADALEALIGAVYLDAGFDAAYAVVKRLLGDRLDGDLRALMRKDYKSALQEYTQSKYQEMPVYEVTAQRGPAHDPEFDITVTVQGKVLGVGTGQSKKSASQIAAAEALAALVEAQHG